MELDAAPITAARPLALDAPTLVHAFQFTAAQRPDEIALRNPGDAVSLTWRSTPSASSGSRQGWPRWGSSAATRSG